MASQLNYLQAPPGWTCADPNPFSPDGGYGSAWSAFCIEDRDDDQFVTGQTGSGPFSARFGRRCDHLENRLADFLQYENRHGRTVILSLPPEMNAAETAARAAACTPSANVVRPDDPPVIIHATTKEAWQSIQADGALKAASLLDSKKQQDDLSSQPNPVAEYLRHEPPEYPDYIMFGVMDSCVPEMVVASYRAGAWVLDENAAFEPGIRLYFDCHRIIRDGLAVRDGLHTIKVHQRLPLAPYLLAAVGAADLDPAGSVSKWTLRKFVDQANRLFRNTRD